MTWPPAVLQRSPRPPVQESTRVARDLISDIALGPLGGILERWFAKDIERVHKSVQTKDGDIFSRVLQGLDMHYDCAESEIRRIPATGPTIVVANHPFGLAEGVILGALLSKIRTDVRFLANSLLQSVEGLQGHILPVNPFGGVRATYENQSSLRQSIAWLKAGRLLVVFPAGEVATLDLQSMKIADRQWTENAVRLATATGATLAPIYFHGTNGPIFHMAGLINDRLRTLMLPRELLNKAGTTIRLSIGAPIPPQRLACFTELRQATDFVRGRTLMLGVRKVEISKGLRLPQPKPKAPAEISLPPSPEVMQREVDSLSGENLLEDGEEFAVYIADATRIPAILLGIGHAREVTFRLAGEGSGLCTDLDRFDRHYQHLFLWNKAKRELAGAYRLAKIDEVISRFGVAGLYTTSLFRISPQLFDSIQPGIELGRSFILPEYQRQFLPLLLLWRGIGRYISRNPQYRYLIGPVSISSRYLPASRALMLSYLRRSCWEGRLSQYVSAKSEPAVRIKGFDVERLAGLISSLQELSAIVSDLEPDRKGVPILLKHYMGLGGRIIEFSVDRSFSNVTDGLVVLDLAAVPARQLERYMGSEEAAAYARTHRHILSSVQTGARQERAV